MSVPDYPAVDFDQQALGPVAGRPGYIDRCISHIPKNMSFQFITAIPPNVWEGSGCFMGIDTLAKGIRILGGEVKFVTPRYDLPAYAAKRTLFNHMLRYQQFSQHDTIVGFDADGYSIAGRHRSPHVASIKGVIADVLPYERGTTWASLSYQAHLERMHAQRADLVITPSRYCAEQLDELYHVRDALVVPELIDLNGWTELLRANPADTSLKQRFIVLSVCRFYPRKRIDVLLRAAALLKERIPELEVRIVGEGPEAIRWRRLSKELQLGGTVRWLGNGQPADSPMSTTMRTYSVFPAFRRDSESSSSKQWRPASRLLRPMPPRYRK